MNDQEIRIAVGEALGLHLRVKDGWSVEYYRFEPQGFCFFRRLKRPDGSEGPSYTETIPDYPNDLNACHDMEKLHGFHDLEYVRLLTWVCDHDWQHTAIKTHRNPIFATARQRCEAFLSVLGKWKE